MIEARGIRKRFGSVVAVDGLDLSVAAGQIVGLVGENGAGKTTTLRLLSGYFEPDEGDVAIDGLDLWRERSAALRMIGYVPESAPLYPDMRVVEYLRYRARLKGKARGQLDDAVGAALEQTDTQSRASWLIGNLSRGLRQRVALADALLGDAKALILDEPTAGLDPIQVKRFVELMRSLSRGRAVIVASHALATLAQLVDSFAVIANGVIVGRGDRTKLCGLAGIDGESSLEDAFATLVSGAE